MRSATKSTTLVPLFVTERAALARQLKSLRSRLNPEACVWVSWPKKAAKLPTTVTEDTIRELALPLGSARLKRSAGHCSLFSAAPYARSTRHWKQLNFDRMWT